MERVLTEEFKDAELKLRKLRDITNIPVKIDLKIYGQFTCFSSFYISTHSINNRAMEANVRRRLYAGKTLKVSSSFIPIIVYTFYMLFF